MKRFTKMGEHIMTLGTKNTEAPRGGAVQQADRRGGVI